MAEGYEQFTDAELDELVAEAADLNHRIWMATDRDVISALIEAGMPRRHAIEQLKIKPLALFARKFYIDTIDAAFGDPTAAARVQHVRSSFGRMRRQKAEQE